MMLASTVESASVCSRATEIRSCRWEWDRKRKRARLLRSLHPNRWLTISIRHFILRLVAPPSSSRPNRFFGDQFRLVFIPLFLSSFGCVVARAWVNCTLHGNLCAIYHLVRSAFHYDFSVLIFFSSSAVHYVFDLFYYYSAPSAVQVFLVFGAHILIMWSGHSQYGIRSLTIKRSWCIALQKTYAIIFVHLIQSTSPIAQCVPILSYIRWALNVSAASALRAQCVHHKSD